MFLKPDQLSLAFLSFVSCPGAQGTAGWPAPSGAAASSLQLGGCNLQDTRMKKILRVLKRRHEGFSDKVGALDATDVVLKEADVLGSPALP